MAPPKLKASAVASEVKKIYNDHIRRAYPQYPVESHLVEDSEKMRCAPASEKLKCGVHITRGDPVDVALSWAAQLERCIPVVNSAHEKRPGGDWEASVIAPEECLCRRSNLYASLSTPSAKSPYQSHYPIPIRGGIYSPNVVVFRDGPEDYRLWDSYRGIRPKHITVTCPDSPKVLPVISVPPVKRPKVTSEGKYSFAEEKEMVKNKIRTILRMTAYFGFHNLVCGSWGCGPLFKNPAEEVARIWRDLLFNDPEFEGKFGTIIFAFDAAECSSSKAKSAASGSGTAGSGSKGKQKSASSSGAPSASSSKSTSEADMAVWLHVFRDCKAKF